MRFDREIFYLKADTESGIEGLILKNREHSHYGASGIGLLHDLLEHPYKPIANPYLDEIAALGAFNEFRCSEQDYDIVRELKNVIYDSYEQDSYRFKWNIKHLDKFAPEIEDLIDEIKEEDYYYFFSKYWFQFNYYFNLGATIFHNRFNNYFNSYSDLYYGLGDEVISKLTPLINSDLENIKLTINYKEREVKVEY